MPSLDWIGKKAVVNHHREVPYRLIHCDKDKSFGDPEAGNLLVQGDNLEALKALLPYYAGKVKCIYIDPPYNTGNEKWAYNDNVNSPEMRDWLGKVVGKEAEDLSRHDKWLCMMYPRLRLLKDFLREDGIIFVSIGDDALHYLLFLLNGIFGEVNFQATFVWKSRAKPSNTGGAKFKPQNDAEYVIAFSKSKNVKFNMAFSGNDRNYPHKDLDGIYRLQTILKSNRGENKRETMQFSLNGYKPPNSKRWQAGEDVIIELWKKNRITFQTGKPMLKYYKHEENEEGAPFYCFIEKKDSGTAEVGKNIVNNILGDFHGFDTIKPIEIVKYLISRVTKENDIILDAFAGSGTTAHAVKILNEEDGGNRLFILSEMDSFICRKITSKRIEKIITGYNYKTKNERIIEVDGLGGGFRYCTLGEPLFDADGNVNAAVSFPDLAAHVFFCETGSPIPKRADPALPLIGTFQGRAIYLLHNADAVGVASDNAGNVLTGARLDTLSLPEPGFSGARIVYGEGCTVPDDRLARLGVTFKQIPYQIEGL
jgi:adenine-specific DNA-methyltransferase